MIIIVEDDLTHLQRYSWRILQPQPFEVLLNSIDNNNDNNDNNIVYL